MEGEKGQKDAGVRKPGMRHGRLSMVFILGFTTGKALFKAFKRDAAIVKVDAEPDAVQSTYK